MTLALAAITAALIATLATAAMLAHRATLGKA